MPVDTPAVAMLMINFLRYTTMSLVESLLTLCAKCKFHHVQSDLRLLGFYRR